MYNIQNKLNKNEFNPCKSELTQYMIDNNNV